MTFLDRDSLTQTTTGTSTGHTQVDARWTTRARVGVALWRGLHWVRRIIAMGWRRADATLTPVGWLALAAVVILIPLGFILDWIGMAVAGFAAAAALIFALPFLLGGRSYGVQFWIPAERVVAGQEVVGTLTVTNTSQHIELPGRIDVPIGQGINEVWVPLLGGGVSHKHDVIVPTHRRGVITIGPVTTVRSDPLGMVGREIAWAKPQSLYVHPATVSVPSTSSGFVHDLEGSSSGIIIDDDISFHQIREYQPGDAQRHISWKATAKTGRLMVRQFDQTLRSRLAVILGANVSEFADDDEFELAVSVAGSLGVRAIRDGRDTAVVISEQIIDAARGAVRAIRELGVLTPTGLLDDLCVVESSPRAMSVHEVCSLTSKSMHDLSIAFVVVGSTLERRKLHELSQRFPRDVHVVVVVTDPKAAPSYRRLDQLGVVTVALLDDFRRLLSGSVFGLGGTR